MPDDQEAEAGTVQQLRVLHRRITELEQAQQTLERSEKQFRELFENASVGVYLTTPDGRIIMANPALVHMLGYSSFEQLSQRNLEKEGFAPGYPRSLFKDLIEKNGRVASLESAWLRQDGTTVSVSEDGWVVRDESGRPLYYEGVVHDITERKKAEEKLKQYQVMVESAQDAIFYRDLESRYIIANNKTLEAFGLLREQVIGKNDYEIMPDEEQAKRNIEDDSLVFRTGKATEFTKCMTDAEGKERWFHAIKVPQFDDRRKIVGLIGVARDITERKKAEASLRENEAKYRDLVEEMTGVIYTLDAQGNVTSVNKAGKAMFGREPQEVIGKTFANWIPPDKLPDAMAVFKRILGGEKITAETVMLDKNGRPHHVEFSSTPIIKDGVVVGTRGIIRDISERKRAEYELQESHKKYCDLVDNITDGVYQIDTKGNFTYVNKVIEERSGIPAEKFVGLNFRDVVIPEYHEIVSANLARSLAGEQVAPFELAYRTATGQTITVETNVRPIYDGNTITGVQGISRDITGRKKAEEKLKESESALRAIIDSVTESVVLMDTDETILAANRTQAERLGTTLDELIGKHSYDFLPDDVAKSRKLQLEKVVRTGQPVIFEDIRGARHILNSFNPIKDSTGKVTRLAIFAFDMTEHKKLEQALRESELRYRSLFESSPVGLGLTTADGKILDCNSTMLAMIGYSNAEIRQVNVRDTYVNPGDRARLLKELQTNGLVRDLEAQLKRKDGTTYWANLTVIPFAFAGENTILATQVDITERKKTEEALREAEQKWRCLAENAPDVILTAKPDGTILYLNRSVPPYTTEEAIGTSVYDYVLSEHRDILRRAFEHVVQTGQPYSYELAGAGPGGHSSWYQSWVGPIKQDGQVVAVMLIATDVTERKQAEDTLRQSETKYRTLLENLTQKVFLKDRNSVYISCNENHARDLRIKADQIVGKTDYDFFPKELAEKYRADDRRIVESGQTTDIEEKYILEGQEFIVHTVKTPVRDKQGNVTAILGIFWDITESKRQERELNLYREKMTRAEQLASLGALSAILAHEMTQPLTAIRLSIENSLADLQAGNYPNDVLEGLKDGLDEVSHAASIIDRLRHFARQSSEKTVSQVNLKEAAERIVRLLNKNAQQANVFVHLKGLEKLPPIYVYEKDMEQLFFALIDNAIHAADGKKNRQLTISGTVKGEQIELQFADNCGGIAPENLDKIFEPFFTTKPAGEGTGLGLCVVKNIVSRAGGKVWAKSDLGKGATFFVTLPITKGMRT
jgi:PAS domain S-box-containing protein